MTRYLSEEQARRLTPILRELSAAFRHTAKAAGVSVDPPAETVASAEGTADVARFELALAEFVGIARALRAYGVLSYGDSFVKTIAGLARERGVDATQLTFELLSHFDFAWGGGGESRSGAGSTSARTADIIARLRPLLDELQARSLLDAPCGDFAWARKVDWRGIDYTGVDIVGDIIRENQQRFATEGIRFIHGDLMQMPLPAADAILCRDCLFHLSLSDALRVVDNFRRSGSTWLLSTTFPDVAENTDIATGHWYPINLQLPPFDFPQPHRRFADGYPHRFLAVWRLADLA